MSDTSPNSELTVALAEAAQQLAENKLPPVEKWQPERTGHSDMRIARDGTWYHEDRVIGRPALVRLFSTILRYEADGRHVLVTPAEMLDIDVEDAPFVAEAMDSEGSGKNRRIAFRLNTGDHIVASAERAIFFKGLSGDEEGKQSVPYLHVRRGLNARLARPVYYELAEAVIAEDAQPPGLWSDGAFFDFGAAL